MGYWEYILEEQPKDTMLLYCKDTLEEIYKFTTSLNNNNILFGIDHGGLALIDDSFFKNNDIEVTENKERIADICRIIKEHLPQNYIPLNGQVLRNAAIDGSIIPFLKSISNYSVVTVGDKRLVRLPKCLSPKYHKHVIIHPTDSWSYKDKILTAIENSIKAAPKPVVVLIQGSYVGTWWISKLHDLKEVFLIDIGRSIDVFYPEMSKQSWIHLFKLKDKYKEYWV